MLRLLVCLFLWVLASPAHADVARGEYLARAGDCASCHTLAGQATYGGGRELKTPFGPIMSTNITPDKVHGIGAYSLAQFDRAVRRGVARDGHHLYPAMPYPSFRRISDADIADLYDYFQHGVKPAQTVPPASKMPFPFNQRWLMPLWNLFFAPHGDFQYRTRHDAEWNRGAYLVETLGHCGACHTVRGIAFQESGMTAGSRTFLSGGTLEYWHAPSLRGSNRVGLAGWSDTEIADFLKTGHTQKSMAFGSMTEVVEVSTQYLTDSDRLAIARYLKSIPPGPAAYAPASPATAMQAEWPGAGVYASACAGCHGVTGQGRPGAPALAGNAAIMAYDPASVIHMVLKGGRSPVTQFNAHADVMPGFEAQLTDREIAEVASFVRQSWGNRAPPVSAAEVRGIRKALKADPAVKIPAT